MATREKQSDYQITISKADLAALPAAEYHGRIHVVDSPEKVQEAVDILSAADIIGFDTETRPKKAVTGSCISMRAVSWNPAHIRS